MYTSKKYSFFPGTIKDWNSLPDKMPLSKNRGNTNYLEHISTELDHASQP